MHTEIGFDIFILNWALHLCGVFIPVFLSQYIFFPIFFSFNLFKYSVTFIKCILQAMNWTSLFKKIKFDNIELILKVLNAFCLQNFVLINIHKIYHLYYYCY